MKLDHGLVVAIAGFISTYLTQNLGFGQAMYVPLYTVSEQFLKEFDSVKFVDFTSNISYIHIIIFILTLIFYFNRKYIKIIPKYFIKHKENYVELTIAMYDYIKNFVDYIAEYPEFFDIPQRMQYGDPDLIINAREYVKTMNLDEMAYYKRSEDYIKVNFHDKNFTVKGYYEWSTTEVKIEKENNLKKVFNVPLLTIGIEKISNKTSVEKYLQDIIGNLISIRQNKIITYHTKIMKDDGDIIENDYITYNGTKRSTEKLEELYMNSFFHPKKNTLWNYIKSIHFNPECFYKFGQSPRIGLLLYGPPGTGKSSFAYRIAMALGFY